MADALPGPERGTLGRAHWEDLLYELILAECRPERLDRVRFLREEELERGAPTGGGWTMTNFPIPPPQAPQLAPGPGGGQMGPPPVLPMTPQGLPTMPPGMLPPGSLPPGMPPGVGSPGMGPPRRAGHRPAAGRPAPRRRPGRAQGKPGDDLADIHEPDFDPTDLGPRPPPRGGAAWSP